MDHVIIVAEQLGSGPFNRGALINNAFLAAPETTDSLAILDIDILPLPGVSFTLPQCDLLTIIATAKGSEAIKSCAIRRFNPQLEII